DEDAHQLRDSQRRMRIVELKRRLLRQVPDRTPVGQQATNAIPQGRRDEEVLLLEPELLAERMVVVWVEHASDVLVVSLALDGPGVVSRIEVGDVEILVGTRAPQAKRVDDIVFVAGNGDVMRDGVNDLRVYPLVPNTTVRTGVLDDAPAKVDVV